jgi:hypothetical protein
MSTTLPSTSRTPLRKVALLLAVAVVLALAWIGSLDALARDYVDTALKRAMLTFAAARSANAIISVAQSMTISAVVSISPGQALDPLNDVVEDFSNLMLAASVSLGAQRLLISIGALRVISGVLTVCLLAWAGFGLRGRASPPWLTRALLLLLFIRFAIPIAALGSEAAFRLAMGNQYNEAQSQVNLTLQPPAEPNGGDADKDSSSFERLKSWLERKGTDFKANVATLKARMENAIEHMVMLMAIFIVQTAVLPLVLLWLSYRMFGAWLQWQGVWGPSRMRG